jgi:hypothetical protein
MRSICDTCKLYSICPLSRKGTASKCDAYLPCDAINNYKAGTELKKPWIEKCCDIICPHCGYEFSDEIRLMGHGKKLPLNYCPVCGKEVDDSKR